MPNPTNIPKGINPETPLTQKQVRALLGGVAPSTVNKWRVTLAMPKPIYMGRSLPVWRFKDITAWLDSLDSQQPTGAA